MGVDDTQPLISHLIELRKRLLNSIIAILVIFLALVYFANDSYQLVSAHLAARKTGSVFESGGSQVGLTIEQLLAHERE